MKHVIEQTAEGLRIRASVPPEKQQALVDELNKCAGGNCSCPTPQYEKVTGVQVSSSTGGVTVNLAVKPGERVDAADIERCLENTARQIGG
jgi:hypothetical protein